MITLLKCLGILIAGLIVSKILVGIAGILSEKHNKKYEEAMKKREAEREEEFKKMYTIIDEPDNSD